MCKKTFFFRRADKPRLYTYMIFRAAQSNDYASQNNQQVDMET